MRIIGVIALFIFMIPGIATSQVTIKVQPDTNRIVIGDQINLEFEVNRAENEFIGFPIFGDTLTDGIEIIEKSPIDSIIKEGNVKLTQKYVITSFDSGLYYIPPFKFIYKANGFVDTIESPADFLEVYSMAIDTTGVIRDIKPFEKAPYTITEFFYRSWKPLLALILLGILAVIGFMIYDKYFSKKPVLYKPKPEEPAHIIALRRLDKLKAEKLWQQNKLKEYYSRLTEIVRIYMEKRFHIKAMEKTTEEILRDYKKLHKTEDNNLKILRGLLNLADLVKFAKGQADQNENITHIENAYTFINSTKINSEEKSEEIVVTEEKTNE